MATFETWNGRTAGQTDADSPLDTTLMDGIRKDLDHLKQALYGNNEGAGTYFTPIWGHNHDGVNSKSATVADGAITGAKISKTVVSSGAISISYGLYWTPTAGFYNIVTDFSGIAQHCRYEIYVSGAWRYARHSITTATPETILLEFTGGAGMLFDGTNQRFYNFTGLSTNVFYYQTF